MNTSATPRPRQAREALRRHPTLDPELACGLHLLPSVRFADLMASRARLEARIAAAPDVRRLWPVEVQTVRAPAFEGGPDVTMLLVRPSAPEFTRPALLWAHGGGFALGAAAGELAFCAEVSGRLGITVASVDYRLAPETPFPGALHDCYGALLYLHHRSHALGVDPMRIAVGGQSAGAGLAAGTALLARDRGEVGVAFQVLEVPELDDRLATDSMRRFHDTPVWTRADAKLSWERYLGGAGLTPGDSDIPYYAAPARAQDLTGLPRTYLSTMELDPLRDEGIDYAIRLLRAGVSVELHHFPGTFHRSTLIPSDVSERARQEVIGAIARGLGLAPPG